jgi:5'(3')-deoxyribonucleotidase
MKSIALDLDDTISTLGIDWIKAYNDLYGDNICRENINDWAIDRFVKPECGKAIYDLLTPHLFRTAGVQPDAQRVTCWLLLHYDIKIVTALKGVPANQQAFVYEAKRAWIDEHFPYIGSENIIVCNDKSMIKADWLIDDGAHNIRAFSGRTIVFDAPYNQCLERWEYDARVKNWNAIEHFYKCQLGLI